MLADSEYRHELETDIEPFKGLLLGLFFISVGASIDFGLIAAQPLRDAGIVVGTMASSSSCCACSPRVRLERAGAWRFSFSLAQVGEFAFVLLAFAVRQQLSAPRRPGRSSRRSRSRWC